MHEQGRDHSGDNLLFRAHRAAKFIIGALYNAIPEPKSKDPFDISYSDREPIVKISTDSGVIILNRKNTVVHHFDECPAMSYTFKEEDNFMLRIYGSSKLNNKLLDLGFGQVLIEKPSPEHIDSFLNQATDAEKEIYFDWQVSGFNPNDLIKNSKA